MGKPKRRFVGKSEAGKGWRIWDTKMRKWWGEALRRYPEELLEELNGPKRPDRVNELLRQFQKERKRRSEPDLAD